MNLAKLKKSYFLIMQFLLSIVSPRLYILAYNVGFYNIIILKKRNYFGSNFSINLFDINLLYILWILLF